MAILGPDVSHWQGAPNWAQVRAAGHEFAVLKATEGTGYVDPTFAANRRGAHAAGLLVGAYHFARAGDPSAEAGHFLGVIGSMQPGEFLVLDWECTYNGDHVAWCKAWLDAVAARTGVRPLIYMNQSEMNARNWMPVSAGSALWLAKYDGSTTAPTTCSCWPSAAMKQYTDKGSVPGVAGGCDVNVFYGSAQQLAAYGATNQEDDDMNANQERVLQEIANRTAALVDVAGRPVEVEARLNVRLDALTELVRQLAVKQGTTVDMAAIEAVVERGVADAIAGIDTTVTVKPAG